MSKEIIVCIGASCSGKTTYAKRLCDNGYFYVDYDNLWDYSTQNFGMFLHTLSYIIRENKKLVIDGYPIFIDNNFDKLKTIASVKLVVLFAPAWVLIDRQKNSTNPSLTENGLGAFYDSVLTHLKEWNLKFIDS